MTEKEALQCKVVLIGESGVGKTSIINRYTTNTYSDVLTATPGASFTTKTIMLKDYDQSIKFEIWDTAGQEKYRALAKVFYKNAAVCILVYDITRKKSFDELKNFWVKEIQANASPNLILAIAGNKDDLYEEEDVDEGEAKELADSLKAIFQKTSAKSSNGVDDLFVKIGKKFLNPKAEDISGPAGSPNKNVSKGDKKNGIKLNKKNSDGKQKKGCC